MKPVDRKNLFLIASVTFVSIALGFVSWILFVVVAFGAGYFLKRFRAHKHSVLVAAAATSFGWVLVALVRDLFESGRASTKLAAFLSLPHASFMYLVLFLLCFIPSLFAAWSGSLTFRLQASKQAG
jgi:hypothetical protein